VRDADVDGHQAMVGRREAVAVGEERRVEEPHEPESGSARSGQKANDRAIGSPR